MNEDWKGDRAEAAMRQNEADNMKKAKAEFKLKKENDPRNIEFYQKGFPELTPEKQEELRLNWVNTNTKNNEHN